VSVRLVGLLAVVAAAIAITGESGSIGAQPVPTADLSRSALPLARTVPATVCPGPETLATPAGADPVQPGGPVLLRALLVGSGSSSAVLARRLPIGGAPAEQIPLAPRTGAAAIFAGTLRQAGPIGLEADAGTGAPPQFSLTQSTLVGAGDLRGLVVSECGEATSDRWLVGGGTSAGRRGRLLLANPTSSPAVVDVVVYGPAGPVSSPAGQAVLVPPGGQTALLLDALAPGLTSTAVHVTTRSGRVVSLLHDSLLRGLVGGGVDDVAAASAPATVAIIPGVSVPAQGANGEPAAPSDPRLPGATAVRVVVPGPDEAIVRVSLLGAGGSVDLGSAGVRTVPAGTVVDIGVTGVPGGSYAARVEADVPVVAGVIVGRATAGSLTAGTDQDPLGKAAPAEFGWAAAVPAMAGSRLVSLPMQATAASARPGVKVAEPAVRASLSLTSTGELSVVKVTELDAAGRPGPVATVQVPADSTRAVDVAATAAGLLIDPGSATGVRAAVVLTTRDPASPMISVLPLLPVGASPGVTPVAVVDPGLGVLP
jgi:Family of unknown function (DUF5719)